MGRAGRGESLVWRKFCVFILYFFSLPEVPAHRSPYPRHPLSRPMPRGLRDAERVVPRPARMTQLAGRPCALEGNSTPSRHWPASEQPRVTAGEAQGSEARGCPGAWPGSLRWRRAGKRRRGWVPGGGGARRTGREYRCLQQRTCRAPLPGWGPSAGLGPAAPLRPPHGLHVFVASYHGPRPPSYQWFSKGGRFCHPLPLRGFGATPETLA